MLMRTLYFHPLSSFCQKVLIALYELELPFERRFVDLGAPADREALARRWPYCRFPVLEDDGHVVAESSIIVEHLGPGLIPSGREAALECRLLDRVFDLHVNEQVGKVVADRLRPADARDPIGVGRARNTLRTSYDVLEARLPGRTWAAGDTFTLADCAAAPALFYAARVEPFQHPHLTAYFERILARPTVARVFEEARPYLHLFPVK
ncbi:glutathione S-transferase family protein [Corallococcus sp. Z5C101001]|uniref:glutathione S-transferase family protein n=1 Tax=Corallococcus sp. Z5C101001 TaxID=2596829 RepID=UPI002105493B|nr:glutathione S-transferase family protein [Corallococcus sp. Z5C101001]